MRYVAAYLLAVLGGKPAPTTQDVEKILGSIGMEFDTAKVKIVVDKLAGKAIDEVIAEGNLKLSSVPSGGAVAAPAAASGSAAAPEAKKEEKKEEKPAESEESDDDMGFGLFD